MTLCNLTICNNKPLSDQTLYQAVTLSPNSIFYRISRGFHRTFAIGLAYRQGTFTPSDTQSCFIWDLHMLYLLRPILFPNLPLFYRTMHFEHPSVLSRFCLFLVFCSLTYQSLISVFLVVCALSDKNPNYIIYFIKYIIGSYNSFLYK